MKKGIIVIVLITLSLILFRPPKIKAQTTSDWSGNIEQGFTDLNMYDLSANSYTALGLSLQDFYRYSNTDILTSYGNTPTTTLGSNGTMYAFNLNMRTMNNYLYSITFYQCANKRIYYANTQADLFLGGQSTTVASRPSNTTIYQANNITELATTDLYCQMITSYFVPNTTTNNSWLGLRLRATNGNITGLYLRAYGFTIRELGIYTSGVEDIIKNSGFATSESVEQVQQSVNRVEEAITGDYEYNDTPNEELEGKEELDNLKNKEEELLGNLDFSGADNLEITIEPETASFIWEIVDALRSMSEKIVLLITSILGLGIIKMILNR